MQKISTKKKIVQICLIPIYNTSKILMWISWRHFLGILKLSEKKWTKPFLYIRTKNEWVERFQNWNSKTSFKFHLMLLFNTLRRNSFTFHQHENYSTIVQTFKFFHLPRKPLIWNLQHLRRNSEIYPIWHRIISITQDPEMVICFWWNLRITKLPT